MNAWRRFLIFMFLLVAFIMAIAGTTAAYLNSLTIEIASTKKDLTAIAHTTKNLSKLNTVLAKKDHSLQLHTDSLTKARRFLKKRNDSLNSNGKMLDIRFSAMNNLTNDPILSYRLAQEAYARKPDEHNRKLILASLSKIDLPYKYLISGYQIEDFCYPFLLLSNSGTNGCKSYYMLNQLHMSIQAVPLKGDRVWVIPMKDNWRFFVASVTPVKNLEVVTYQLCDSKGQPLCQKIQGAPIQPVQFITKSKINFNLFQRQETLQRDLIKNESTTIKHDTSYTPLKVGYYSEIYDPLATRSDGYWAAAYKEGLILVNNKGERLNNTLTKAPFDPSYSLANWSPDDKFLALYNYGEDHVKMLGIWNPERSNFKWMNAKGWIVDAYAWSNHSHFLAYAGRTENNTDISIHIYDPATSDTDKIVYKSDIPVKCMMFLPGDHTLVVADLDGNLKLIDIGSGNVVRSGVHREVQKLYLTPNGFVSYSYSDIRIWTMSPLPKNNWAFNSYGSRIYNSMGAADRFFKLLAVPYYEESLKQYGVEVREVKGIMKLALTAPLSSATKIAFSPNGKSLILETFDTVRIWNTNTWNHSDFALLNKDSQFIDLRFNDSFLIVHTLANDENEFDYKIAVDRSKPIFMSRSYFKEKVSNIVNTDYLAIAKKADGWQAGNIYKYESAGFISNQNDDWGIYVKCRDGAFAPTNCDIQFVPINPIKLIQLYDHLLWKPNINELLSVGKFAESK